jgi:hypothetical protein
MQHITIKLKFLLCSTRETWNFRDAQSRELNPIRYLYIRYFEKGVRYFERESVIPIGILTVMGS